MCGIWGFVTSKKDYAKKYELARELCLATVVRGAHATGFAYSDGTHERYYKEGEPAGLVVRRGEFEQIADDRPHIIVGHNRYATHGDPKDNINNHPFKSRTLQFIHNGVIRNYDSLKAEYHCYSECDSEIILRILERADRRVKGIQNVYKEVQGSMACALLDTRKLRLWLWRNYGNPIYLSYHAGLNMLAFASTRDIFDKACKSAGLADGWTKGQYWSDEYILTVKYNPDDDKVLRELVEVEHKHVDPAVVTGWDDDTLTHYARYYRDREAKGRGRRVTHAEAWSGRRRAVWDKENHCWTV